MSLTNQIKEIVLNSVYLEPAAFNRVEPGQLTMEGGRLFVSQFSHFTRNFPRWLAAVASNCPESEVRKFIAGNLYEEEIGPAGQGSHYDLLLRQGEAMGLTRGEIETTVPFPRRRSRSARWNTSAGIPHGWKGWRRPPGSNASIIRRSARKRGSSSSTTCAPGSTSG